MGKGKDRESRHIAPSTMDRTMQTGRGARSQDCGCSREVQMEGSHRDCRIVSPTTEEQKAAEAAGKWWFIMTCKGTALKHVKMHSETGCTCETAGTLQ
jgi:hypothetical protein